MQQANSLAKHKGAQVTLVVSLPSFRGFAAQFILVVLAGELLKQLYALTYGRQLLRSDWDRDFGWTVPLIGFPPYFHMLWQWVWLLKSIDTLWIYYKETYWPLYSSSIPKDLVTTGLFFLFYYTKEYVNSLTGFQLSGHLLIAILASSVLINEAFNSKRYGGPKPLQRVAESLHLYHLFSVFFTALIYHTFLESLSGMALGLVLSYRLYFSR